MVAWMAVARGRSFNGFLLLSLILTPIVGLGLLLAVGRSDQAMEQRALNDGKLKDCPECPEVARSEATVCPFCRRSFLPESGQMAGL
jgi:hypothetical protein